MPACVGNDEKTAPHEQGDRIDSRRSHEEALGLAWPGNIRELENFMERSVILTHGAALQAPIAELSNNGRTNPSSWDARGE